MRAHGRSAYANGYCDCPVCTQAHADYQREYRARPRDPAALAHGTNSTYTNYGCRCGPCKAAASADQRQRRQGRALAAAILQARMGPL